jgi:hypothetical protein
VQPSDDTQPHLLEEVPCILLSVDEPAQVIKERPLPETDELGNRLPIAAQVANQQELAADPLVLRCHVRCSPSCL